MQRQRSGILNETNVLLNFVDNGKDSAGYIVLKKRKWFENDLIIEEIRTLKSITDTTGNIFRNYALNCFVFKDLRNGKAYAYANFSDTAKPQKTFKVFDTLQLINGGYYEHSKIVSCIF